MFFGGFLEEIEAAAAIVVSARGQDSIQQAHRCGVGSAKGRRLYGGGEAFVRKARDWGDKRIRDANAIGAVGARLAQTFHCLAKTATKTDGDDHVAFFGGAGQVRGFSGRGGSDRGKAEQDEVIVQEADQI